MSQITKTVFGAVALSLMLGAVQFASGRDLGLQGSTTAIYPAATSLATINRVSKTDRAPRVATSTVAMRTVALPLHGLSEMSVLMQVPVARVASPAGSLLAKPGSVTKTVACEPMVSVLTDVAKLLQPGRCIT
jgi:hypothetical protein